MTRERKIAIGKDYSEKFVVGAYPESPLLAQANNYGWYNPRNHMYFGTTQAEELAIIADARAAAANYVSPNAWNRSRPTTIKGAIEKHFSRKGYSAAFATELAKFVDYSPWQEFDQQQRLISFQMLNEFLAQDAHEIYGDFLEEKWDELYDKAIQFIFNEYPHSAKVLREFHSNNILTFRPRLPKAAQKEIEALSKEQINKLRALSVISEAISNSNARTRLKSALAVLNGEQSVSVPPSQIINTFARAFAKAVGASNATAGINLLEVQKQFIEVLSTGGGYLTAERAKSASDVLFTNDVLRYANYLYDNSDKFTLSELFFASICWIETRLIARTGSKEDVLGIFLQVMDTYKDQPENVLEFFRMVGEAGASYDGEVPTMSHWKKAFSEGYLDTIMGAEITLSLIAGSDKTVTKLERQRMYRRAFKAQ